MSSEFTNQPADITTSGENEVLAEFLLAPVPRATISPAIRRAASSGCASVILILFGLAFAILGLVVFVPLFLSGTWKEEPMSLMSALFPLVGLAILYFTIRTLRRRQWLLVNGTVGEFLVTGIVDTNVKINNQIRYRADMKRLDDPQDTTRYTYATHIVPKVEFLMDLKKSGRSVFGLYDPRQAKPVRAIDLPEAWFQS